MGCMACLSLSLFLPLSLSLSTRLCVCGCVEGLWSFPFSFASSFAVICFVLLLSGCQRTCQDASCPLRLFLFFYLFLFLFLLLPFGLMINRISFFLFVSCVHPPTPSLVATHAPFIYIFFFAFPATPQCSPGTERSPRRFWSGTWTSRTCRPVPDSLDILLGDGSPSIASPQSIYRLIDYATYRYSSFGTFAGRTITII